MLKIKKVNPHKREVLMLNFVFFLSVFLFFGSLVIVYSKLN